MLNLEQGNRDAFCCDGNLDLNQERIRSANEEGLLLRVKEVRVC